MAGKYERKKQKRGGAVIVVLLILCVCALGIWLLRDKLPLPGGQKDQVMQTEDTARQTESVDTQPLPTQPPRPSKVATATIGATGDILLHDLVIKSGYDAETDSYNFDNIFKWFSAYVSELDYAAANLEVTLAGKDNGYPYAGYPSFNSPDEIVDALKDAGFDMLLTANNHAYDTSWAGFKRTQQVIQERELDHIGTRLSKNDKAYVVRDLNGIKVGMICYTYCSSYNTAGNFKLNGISLPADASALVNAFHYKDLEKFYSKLAGEIQQMRLDGAETIVIFMHWGTEYETTPNASQKKIAQRLCDMGIDVIVGNHAHVPQPVELLTSSTFASHKTLCLYSTGNAVSNIYGGKNFPVQTEDGMLFTLTFAKYSDGTVIVENANVMPTWVWRYDNKEGVRQFQIMTMKAGSDWKSEMDLTDELLEKCQASYDRTMEIVGEGLETANTWFAQRQEEKEIALGIR